MTIGPTSKKTKAEKAREEMLDAESRVKKLEASLKKAKVEVDKYTAALYRAELSVKNSKADGI